MKNLLTYNNKNIYIYLISIYGVNKKTSLYICNFLGINPYSKVLYLTNLELKKIEYFIEQKYLTDRKLKQKIKSNIKQLIDLKCYKGRRHFLGLPVRGQRTQDNAKTQKRLSNFNSTLKKNDNKR